MFENPRKFNDETRKYNVKIDPYLNSFEVVVRQYHASGSIDQDDEDFMGMYLRAKLLKVGVIEDTIIIKTDRYVKENDIWVTARGLKAKGPSL